MLVNLRNLSSTRQTFLCCRFFVFALHFRTYIVITLPPLPSLRRRRRRCRRSFHLYAIPIARPVHIWLDVTVLLSAAQTKRKNRRNETNYDCQDSKVALIRRGVTNTHKHAHINVHERAKPKWALCCLVLTAHWRRRAIAAEPHLYKTNECKPFCVTLVLNLNAQRRC